MTASNQTSGLPDQSFQGPMVGGTTRHLGEFRAANGRKYGAWLQFGGEIHHTGSGASKVDGKWIKHPPRPPSRHPVVTLTPVGGGPKASFCAAVIVDLARCAASFRIADLWDENDLIEFPPNVTEHMGDAIERGIPINEGMFTTTWAATSDEPDALPF